MATPNDKPDKESPKQSLSDIQARDHFIAVALREIIVDQIAKKNWNHEMAAVLAVRYANAVMVARTETAPLKVTVSKGAAPVQAAPLEQPIREEPPKSIAEIIGDNAEPVEEVK